MLLGTGRRWDGPAAFNQGWWGIILSVLLRAAQGGCTLEMRASREAQAQFDKISKDCCFLVIGTALNRRSINQESSIK
jgi:hypothetical protein